MIEHEKKKSADNSCEINILFFLTKCMNLYKLGMPNFLLSNSPILTSGMDMIKFFPCIEAQKRGNVIPRFLSREEFISSERSIFS